MEQRFKKMIDLFTFNFKGILIFELIYKLIGWMIYTPILLLLFRLSLHFSGYGFITGENFFSYLCRPLTLIMILILFALFSLLLFGEMSGLVYGFHASYYQMKVSSLDLLSLSLKSLLKLMISNVWMTFLFLIGILMFWFNLKGDYFPNLIPTGLLDDYVVSNRLWMILFAVLGFLILCGCVKWIYCAHYYNLSKLSFVSSIKASIQMTKYQQALGVFVWYVLMIMSNLFLHMLGFSLMAALADHMDMLVDWSVFSKILFAFLITLVMLLISYSYISERYYHWVRTYEVGTLAPIYLKLNVKLKRVVAIILLVFCITGSSGLTQSNLYQQTFDTLLIMKKPEITAHRGYSAIAPENTLAAIELAIEHDADYIEVDVQKTKDNVLVLFHDQTLKRMAGINQKISDLTYDELSTIDIGSSFDEIFHGSKVATLEEALQLCDGKVKLNIELKSSEDDLGQLVVDMVKDYEMLDEIVITGADYEAIKRVKEYDQDVIVGYIASALYGDISEMEEVDIFSLRSSFITADLVQEIHRHGKLVYAWTVNDLDETKRLMELGVDNIITDYVEHTFEVKASLIN